MAGSRRVWQLAGRCLSNSFHGGSFSNVCLTATSKTSLARARLSRCIGQAGGVRYFSVATAPTTETEDPHRGIPMLSSLRPAWPSTGVPEEVVEAIPKRTVPSEKLFFELSMHVDDNKLLVYPHLKYHPADLKVRLYVSIDDLGLTEDEQNIFCKLIGPRFNPGKRMAKLVCSRFPERGENQKFLILQLEQLIEEAKKIVRENPEEIMAMKHRKRQWEKQYPRQAVPASSPAAEAASSTASSTL
jgi:hypothetical protein